MSDYIKDITILYVEDEDDVRDGYTRALKRVSHQLYTASNGSEGLELYKKFNPDIVVSDIRMPVMNGLDMVKKIKELNPDANIIFTTAHSESSYLLEAIELHVEGYLLKPVQKNSMVDLIKKLSKNIALKKENTEQKIMLQHIIDSENSILIITDMSSILFASKSFLKLFGVEETSKLNNNFISLLDVIRESTTLVNKKSILKSISNGVDIFEYLKRLDEIDRVTEIKLENGLIKSFYINISKINNKNFLINLTDITKIEKEREDTHKKAYIDGLTMIYNRNKLEEVFEYEVKQSKRYKSSFSIAILDIDNFKNFNDTYGHLIGDEVLISLAQLMKQSMRETDIIARWGGEEFVILFNKTDLENATLLANKFRVSIENIQHEIAGRITASFGVTQLQENDTLESIFQRADEALYLAKESGRNCVKVK